MTVEKVTRPPGTSAHGHRQGRNGSACEASSARPPTCRSGWSGVEREGPEPPSRIRSAATRRTRTRTCGGTSSPHIGSRSSRSAARRRRSTRSFDSLIPPPPSCPEPHLPQRSLARNRGQANIGEHGQLLALARRARPLLRRLGHDTKNPLPSERIDHESALVDEGSWPHAATVPALRAASARIRSYPRDEGSLPDPLPDRLPHHPDLPAADLDSLASPECVPGILHRRARHAHRPVVPRSQA